MIRYSAALLCLTLFVIGSAAEPVLADPPVFSKIERGPGGVIILEEMQPEARERTVKVPVEVRTAGGFTKTVYESRTETYTAYVPVLVALSPDSTSFFTTHDDHFDEIGYRNVFRQLRGREVVVTAYQKPDADWLDVLRDNTLIVVRDIPEYTPTPVFEMEFLLSVPGTNVESLAWFSGRMLKITNEGEVTIYERSERYDNDNYAGYFCHKLSLPLQWPRDDKGTLMIGRLISPQGNAVFRESQMRIVGQRDPNTSKPAPTPPSDGAVELLIINETGSPVSIVFFDEATGQENVYHQLAPREEVTQDTFVGHLWFAKNSKNQKVGEYQAPDSAQATWLVAPPIETSGVWRSPEAGVFISQGNNIWTALDSTGQKVLGQFEELERTDQFVAIYNKDQQRWIRIYVDKAITTAPGIDGWETLGTGKWID